MSNFKQTEIGEIPEEWEIRKIGDICKTASGGTPSRKEAKYFGGGIPWVKSAELRDNVILQTEETLSPEGLKHSSAKIFPKGTVLVAMYGATVGKTGILGIDAATNQAICAFFPDRSKLIDTFLWYWLQHLRPTLIRQSIGAAQPNISQELLRQMPIPLPPLEEQRRIAGVLRLVDEIAERTRRIIGLYEKVKKHALNHLLTKGIGHSRFKQTEIGEIPEGWEVVQISEAHEDISATVSKVKKRECKPSGKFPVIDQGAEFVGGYTDEGRPCSQLPVIVFGDHTRIFKFVDFPFVRGADGVKVLKPKPEFDAKFLYYALSALQIPTIGYQRHYSVLCEQKIPLPPLEEQKQIAELLNTLDKTIENERRYLQGLEKLKKWMLDNLLTGKVCLPEWVDGILSQVFPQGVS